MVGDSGTGRNGDTYRYYACISRKNHKTCDCRSLQKAAFEDFIVERTLKILNPANIKMIAQRAAAAQLIDRSLLDAMSRRLQDAKTGIVNILRAIEQGIITPSTKERLIALENEKASLEDEIRFEETKQMATKVTTKEVAYWLESFTVDQEHTHEFKRRLIDALVNNIFVFEDHVVVAYNYKDGTEQISFDDLPDEITKKNPPENGSDGSVSGFGRTF